MQHKTWVALALGLAGLAYLTLRRSSRSVTFDAPDENEAEDEDIEEESAPARYLCSVCQVEIYPDFVWWMESGGPNHQWLFIEHHCACVTAEGSIVARYRVVPDMVLHLAQAAPIRRLASGGWRWEAPVRLRWVTPADPAVVEFRETLEHVRSVSDFLRLAG